MYINRRKAIKGAAAAGAALGLGLSSPMSSLASGPTLARVKGDPAAATKKAVELLGGMSKFMGRGAKVVIKPNMGFAVSPSVGGTTSPEVVRALCEMALEAGARSILIADHPVHKAQACLEQTGIKSFCSDLQDTTVITLDDKRFFVERSVPEGRQLTKTRLLKDIVEADLVINAPVAKTHGATTVTLGMKNLMGAIHNRFPFHTILDLHQAIADLASLVRPQLIVLDASRCMITSGPGGPGKLVLPKTIVAGTDQVAVDALGVGLAPWYDRQFKPVEIKHIARAAEMGLGEIHSDLWDVRSAEV